MSIKLCSETLTKATVKAADVGAAHPVLYKRKCLLLRMWYTNQCWW